MNALFLLPYYAAVLLIPYLLSCVFLSRTRLNRRYIKLAAADVAFTLPVAYFLFSPF
ncbi:MAG: hypothetical protein HPY50_17370 [Firmicutes bacterium]|nr:hypothetical protein [Bacillota bacterium]